MRCRSWRFTGAAHETPEQLPVGRDRSSWRPCRNKLVAGQVRCQECAQSLLMCPNTAVRRALVKETPQDDWVLQALTTDPNPGIAALAEQRTTPALAVPSPTTTPSVWS